MSVNPQTIARTGESVLATNRVLRNTYLLLSMTLLFSAAAAGLSMMMNVPPGVSLVTSLVALGLLWFGAVAPGFAHLLVPISLFAIAAVAGVAVQWLKAPSVAGRKAMDDIDGFRLSPSGARASRA